MPAQLLPISTPLNAELVPHSDLHTVFADEIFPPQGALRFESRSMRFGLRIMAKSRPVEATFSFDKPYYQRPRQGEGRDPEHRRERLMNVIKLLQVELQWAHELLELVMQDVTPQMAAWQPPGTANPLGATYAHAVFSEDGVVNVALRGGAPLFEGEWKGRTGIDRPQWSIEFDWARSLTLNLDAFREYARAVYASAEAYLQEIDESDLDRQIDLSGQDLGLRPVGWVFTALVTSHLNNMAGEISVLKGLQGGRGYPF